MMMPYIFLRKGVVVGSSHARDANTAITLAAINFPDATVAIIVGGQDDLLALKNIRKESGNGEA